MSRPAFRYLIAALLLAATALGGWWLRSGAAGDRDQPATTGYRLVADIDHWHRTPRQQWVTAAYDLRPGPQLADVPLTLGNWQGVDVSRSRQDVLIYLEPDHYVSRLYTLPDGRALWLSLIGSRQARSFHPPQICYTGWQTEVQGEEVTLAEGRLHMLRVVARRGEEEHVILYFFLWPDAGRTLEDGLVMFKVTATQRWGSLEETVALEKVFVRLFFVEAEDASPDQE
jgi:hypothetical protein